MQRFASRSIFGTFSIILLSLVAGSSSSGLPCTVGPPICQAAPGDRICSNDSSRQCDVNPTASVPAPASAAFWQSAAAQVRIRIPSPPWC